jgi:hypothetical protein
MLGFTVAEILASEDDVEGFEGWCDYMTENLEAIPGPFLAKIVSSRMMNFEYLQSRQRDVPALGPSWWISDVQRNEAKVGETGR